jgi:hypothetical protein
VRICIKGLTTVKVVVMVEINVVGTVVVTITVVGGHVGGE